MLFNLLCYITNKMIPKGLPLQISPQTPGVKSQSIFDVTRLHSIQRRFREISTIQTYKLKVQQIYKRWH
jgi:hypothetical protein